MRTSQAFIHPILKQLLLFSSLLILPALVFAAGDDAVNDYQLGVKAYQNRQYVEARNYWEVALTQGSASAAYNLGILLSAGLGGDADPQRAVSLYQRAAEAGLAAAQHNLALAYYSGTGVKQNSRLAREWWQRAALQGHDQAQYNLGTLLWNGDGVERDEQQALKLFHQSSESGNSAAQNFLDSIQPDTATGIPYIAQRTDSNAQINILLTAAQQAYARQDYALSLSSWLEAAKSGSAYANYQLAHLYSAGLGTAPDPQIAFTYIQQAANKGLPEAQFEMGRYYIAGEFVSKNDTLALYWMQSASDQNLREAQDYIEQLR